MFQAAMRNAAVVTGLAACGGDLHRAFWLLVHHLKLFGTACDVDYVDSHAGQAQHIDLRVHLPVRRDQPSMDAFCASIRDFYKKELHCGDVGGGRVRPGRPLASGGRPGVAQHPRATAGLRAYHYPSQRVL